jgi:uncharacterized phiE125 gp8 family phage protein
MGDVPHSLRLTTAPASEPLTLAELKLHCRLEGSYTDEDDLLTAYLATARGLVEKHSERGLIAQTWTLYLDCFPQEIELRKCPVSSATVAITYTDTDGATQTLATDQYRVDHRGEPARIHPAYGVAWPSTRNESNAVAVVFSVGYTSVPAEACMAIKLLVGHWYRNREAVGQVGSEIELAYMSLVESIKWGGYR